MAGQEIVGKRWGQANDLILLYGGVRALTRLPQALSGLASLFRVSGGSLSAGGGGVAAISVGISTRLAPAIANAYPAIADATALGSLGYLGISSGYGLIGDFLDDFREAYSVGETVGNIGFKKPPSWPSSKKVTINVQHIVQSHTAAGQAASGRASGGLYPEGWGAAEIERAVRQAFNSLFNRVRAQGSRHLVQGTGGGLKIEMWYNAATKTIETAYPIP